MESVAVKVNQLFIPATMSRSIGDGVFFRPIRSWHSATYAGEKLTKIPNTNDGSGCVRNPSDIIRVCSIPLTVTHRLYWHERDHRKTVSAFLSYPNAMGACDEYFWEVYRIGDDIERYFGENAEAEMEEIIRKHFNG